MGKLLQVLLACCFFYVASAVSYNFGIPAGFTHGAPGYLISPTGQRYFDPYWCQRGKDPITIYPQYRPQYRPTVFQSFASFPSYQSYQSYPSLPSGCGPSYGGSGGYYPYQTQQYAPQVQYPPQILPQPQQQVSLFGGQQPEQPSLGISSNEPITTLPYPNPDDRQMTIQPYPYPGQESSQNLQVLPAQGQDQMTTLPYPPPQQTYSAYPQQYSQDGGMQTLPYPAYGAGGSGGMQTLPYYGGSSYYPGQYQSYPYGQQQQQQQQQPQQQQQLQVQPQQQQG